MQISLASLAITGNQSLRGCTYRWIRYSGIGESRGSEVTGADIHSYWKTAGKEVEATKKTCCQIADARGAGGDLRRVAAKRDAATI